jgi:hypothetical protein
MKLLSKLSERQLGILAAVLSPLLICLALSLVFVIVGICARAFHWMLAGF